MMEQAAPIPSGFTNTRSLTPHALGVGKLLAPDGWQEIRWCQPPNGPEQRGLIVTRETCVPQSQLNPRNSNVFIYEFDSLTGGMNGGGNTEAQFSTVPSVSVLGPVPFSFYSPYSSGSVHATSPLVTFRNGQQPIFQARTVDYPNGLPGTAGTGSVKSRFIVMPDGNCGINNEDPRAALDVLDANIPNMPVAILGNALPFSQTGLAPRVVNGVNMNQTYSRHLAIVPRLKAYGYNMISRAEDLGMFFTNGLGTEGSNTNGALVIAPYTKDQNAGGLRMEANGNTELRGNFRCTKLTVNAKWWPDAVFADNYRLMPLSEVEKFIHANRHLPGIPSEDSVVQRGQDVGALQVLQQQKIEELTLYAIEQEKQLKQQQAIIAEQKQQMEAQEARLQKLETLVNPK
jgi:hypothetical protein